MAFHEEVKLVGMEFLLAYIQHYVLLTDGREAVRRCEEIAWYARRSEGIPKSNFGAPPFTNTDLFGRIEVSLPGRAVHVPGDNSSLFGLLQTTH